MRCLANALLLVPPTRQILVDLDFPLAATPLLKSQDRDDEFLISRILFLTTYEKSLDVAQLVDKGQLAMLISTNLARHAQQHSGLPEQGHASPQDDLALSETLKLLFNLIHFCPTRTRAFSPAVPHVLQLLSTRSLARPPLEGPVSDLITALINLDLEDPTSDPTGHEALFSSAHSACHIERLVFILEKGIEDYSEAELDKVATPLLTLIRRTYDLAPNAVKHRVQDLLLPSDEERSRPLGSSDTLPSRLLRLSTSSMVPTLREHISSLLFELSERDPSTFVRNIGYGYASGFLMAHDLPLPEGSLGGNVGRGDNERQQGSADPESINPITGQRLNAESVVNMPEMTDEEKEREAERLFVLFERLKKTGVMNVKNPLRVRNLSLVPYVGDIILRHNDAVVVYDSRSRQLSLRGTSPGDTVDLPASECPYCHRPYREEPQRPDLGRQTSAGDLRADFVSPEYFRMLQTYPPDGEDYAPPPSPRRRLAQPVASARISSTPAQEEVLHGQTRAPSPIPRGISSSAFCQGFYTRFFVEKSLLGRGGRGVVFHVEHVLDGVSLGEFACKRVPVGDDHEWLKKVLVEVVLLQKLSHPNLVSYRHVWLEDVRLTTFGPSVPCAFILQEFCNSGDLLHYISPPMSPSMTDIKDRRRRRSKGQLDASLDVHASRHLSFDEIYSFFKDITSGLNYLHANGFIHRDLKPSNCLLHQVRGETKVLVSDFGEAQEANKARKSSGATGTISYCAPEVLRPEWPGGPLGAFTAKSDIFSLGMILYFMCFGRLPYINANGFDEESEDLEQLRAEISAWRGFTDEARTRADLPDQLYRFLKRLLSDRPSQRPSAEDILRGMSSGTGLGEGLSNHHANQGTIFEEMRSSTRIAPVDSPGPRLSTSQRRGRPTSPTSIGFPQNSQLRNQRPESPMDDGHISHAEHAPDAEGDNGSSLILRQRRPTNTSLSPPRTFRPALLPPANRVSSAQQAVNHFISTKPARISFFFVKYLSMHQACYPSALNVWMLGLLMIPAVLDLVITHGRPGITVGLGVFHVITLYVAQDWALLCHYR
ncbi:MAG: putative serine/threonine-protein kinase iks1 [Caeruleum heppii]|nr:MAG: putative serine/threonine-protein kinase iks1 [Caeruleum heppii]